MGTPHGLTRGKRYGACTQRGSWANRNSPSHLIPRGYLSVWILCIAWVIDQKAVHLMVALECYARKHYLALCGNVEVCFA